MSLPAHAPEAKTAHHHLPLSRRYHFNFPARPVKRENVYLPAYSPSVPPKAIRDSPGPFITTMAHELKNPLGNINLAVQMLGLGLKGEEFIMCLDVINRSVKRISELISEQQHKPGQL